ncbi:hypothetical protein SKAU_G00181980 [Synaphobranchus kaupii]|uniref:Uncharacterized protein n=1 Tax=Synaphobranchus kaupii TaxID=118154 RepID=A0A9Q1IVG9_SYNKA|nr:hypothetical protein SKAU_G00181980 [Synaphobranchus kaupii]
MDMYIFKVGSFSVDTQKETAEEAAAKQLLKTKKHPAGLQHRPISTNAASRRERQQVPSEAASDVPVRERVRLARVEQRYWAEVRIGGGEKECAIHASFSLNGSLFSVKGLEAFKEEAGVSPSSPGLTDPSTPESDSGAAHLVIRQGLEKVPSGPLAQKQAAGINANNVLKPRAAINRLFPPAGVTVFGAQPGSVHEEFSCGVAK